MAIGPESDRMASGRVVVVAGFEAVVGAAAVVLGVGPQLTPAAPETRLAGAAAIALGIVLLAGALALWLRVPRARAAGMAGAVAAVALGLGVAALAVASLGACDSRGPDAAGCQALVAVLGGIGLILAALGTAAAGTLLRARRGAFRRPPGR